MSSTPSNEDDSPELGEPHELPMFPLGSVLFPDGVLPLHIFEIRYQQLLNTVLEADRRFGVVLISRGFEVGGGDERTTIGTVAEVQEHRRFDDGRAAVVCHGTARFQVEQWLDDEPFPRAIVRELPVEPEQRNDRDLFNVARQKFDDVLRLALELGRLDSIPDTDWAHDVEAASWQLAARSPCTTLDQQTILAAPTRAERLQRIDELLGGTYQDLELMGNLEGPA